MRPSTLYNAHHRGLSNPHLRVRRTSRHAMIAAWPTSSTQAVQDYLKAIHAPRRGRPRSSPVDIAAAPGRPRPVRHRHAQAAGRGRLDRLRARHRGAGSPPPGVAEARRVIRRHRLVELFLTRVLGLDWSEVDAEAEALEHAISPRLEQAHRRPPGRAARRPARPPDPDVERRAAAPRPAAAERLPRRPARRHPRGAGRQPGPAAALAGARPDARGDGPDPAASSRSTTCSRCGVGRR